MYRWERRDKKKEAERKRMKKHSRSIGQIYKNVEEVVEVLRGSKYPTAPEYTFPVGEAQRKGKK